MRLKTNIQVSPDTLEPNSLQRVHMVASGGLEMELESNGFVYEGRMCDS